MRQIITLTVIFGYILMILPTLSFGGPTAATVRRAQEALKAYGIGPGPIDGIMGSQTRKAIMIFQAENMLEETGILDKETQDKLVIAVRYPPSNIDESDSPVSPPKIVPMKTNGGDNLSPESPEISPSTALMKDETSKESVESSSKTVAEKENPFKPHLSRTAIIRIAVLAGFSLAALRPIGWGILTGISLISSALMFRLIGTHLNSPFYFVFAVVYSTPMLFHLISKSWDIALVFTVCLGMPVIVISKYAIGSDWVIATCSGLVVMTLLPLAYQRIFTKSRFRQPDGILYYRF